MFIIGSLTACWTNSRVAGDLRRNDTSLLWMKITLLYCPCWELTLFPFVCWCVLTSDGILMMHPWHNVHLVPVLSWCIVLHCLGCWWAAGVFVGGARDLIWSILATCTLSNRFHSYTDMHVDPCLSAPSVSMYRLWLHGFYGPQCPRKAVESLTHFGAIRCYIEYLKFHWFMVHIASPEALQLFILTLI